MGIVHLGNVMACSATVTEKLIVSGERCVRLKVRADNQYGETKISGAALLVLA